MTAAPTIYLDECVDYNLVGALRKRGFSVTSVFDEDTGGLDDAEQLAFAARRGWVLVTHNGKHFAQLHQKGRQHAGIIVLPERPPFERLLIRAAMTIEWISTQDYHGKLFRRGQLQELIEEGYSPPGSSVEDLRIAVGRAEG